jgi:very-short-patch-repair endonuclease
LGLTFDFYFPDYNLCIEYDGKQHHQPIPFFGGEEHYQYRKKLDLIKTKYCEENNIDLLRIPYWEKENIEQILINKLSLIR